MEVGVRAYHGVTTIHPLGLAIVLILGVMLIMAPRQNAVLPMIILACFVPSAQRIVIISADFDLLRILVLFGWARILLRNEFKGFVWNRMDTLLVAWMMSGTIIMTLNLGTAGALLNRTGWMFDGIGMYFLFRCIFKEWKDLERVATAFILVSFPVAIAFALEWSTGRNAFSMFGGVSPMTGMRDGALRCQGAYSHSILAGCFWAAVVPFMFSRLVGKRKWLALLGIGNALFIIFATTSSTPILSVILSVVGVSFWALRSNMQVVRWSFSGLLVVLHFAMNMPVWHLLARVNVVGSSTGWHRYKIMDVAINNIGDWWLLGEANPMRWGAWEMRDITNQYILEGLRGGLLTLVFFIALLSIAFGFVGRAAKTPGLTVRREFFVWCIGVALFVHVGTFFGVSYFGQIIMLVYLNLAMIGSLPTVVRAAAPLKSRSAPVHAMRMPHPSLGR